MRAPDQTHGLAKALRRRMSLPEVLLWQRLRRRVPGNPVFRRQHPVGRYIVDFYCSACRLAVEIDGQAHGMGNTPERDIQRTAYLRGQNIEVVRYTAVSVLRDPDEIAHSIYLAATSCPLSHRPSRSADSSPVNG